MGKRWFTASIIIIIFVVGIIVYQSNDSRQCNKRFENPIYVHTSRIMKGNIEEWVHGRGIVHTGKRATLCFETSGRIIKLGIDKNGITLKPGSRISGPTKGRHGHLLAALDSREQKIMLQQAEAELAECRARLREISSAIKTATALNEHAEKIYKRTQILRKKQVVSQRAIDEANKDFLVTQNSLAEARARKIGTENQIIVCQAKVAHAKLNLEKCHLYAPFDGVIARMDIRTGDMIRADEVEISEEEARLKSSHIVIINPSEYEIIIELPLYQGRLIKPNSIARVEPIGKNSCGSSLSGNVDSISPILSTSTRMVRVRILCKSSKSNMTIFDGESVKVMIQTASASDTPLLPRKALLYENGKPYCYVTQNNKTTVKKVFPVIGISGEDMLQVLQGLVVSEEVVTTGKHLLRDGMKISSKRKEHL